VTSALLTPSSKKVKLEEVTDWYLSTYENDPLRWIYDSINIKDGLWEKQEEIISSVFQNSYTAVRSGHSTGKTFASALCVLAFLYTQIPSKVITTAPTFRQVAKILWRDIRKLYTHRKIKLGGRLLTLELFCDDDWFALGLHPREYDINAFQGYHSENILVVLDESPGVSSDLYDSAISLLTSENAHLLEIGNPTSPSGHFYNAFQKNSKYNKIHINCLDSPNIKAGKVIRPYLVIQKWINDRKDTWGENSPLWQSRVLGEFSTSEENSFAPLDWVERAMG